MMPPLCTPAALVLALLPLVASQQQHPSFSAFVAAHSKVYADSAEALQREAIFLNNDSLIKEHNAGNHSYSLAHNQFSDLTWDEWREIYTIADLSRSRPKSTSRKPADLPWATPPKSMDWRTENAVSPVKDQGQCGSCWSFSSTGAIEGVTAIASGSPAPSLSEQQLIDCESSNKGCKGGLQPNSFSFVAKNGGITTEDAYPYIQDIDDTAHKCASSGGAVTIRSYEELDEGDESGLLSAVGLLNPVAIDIDSGGDGNFMFYESGVFSSRKCSSVNTDHAVLAVGYGTDAASGMDYWLVKNSWSAEWGLGGYFMIERGKNMCGVAAYCSYPVV
jgi:C1A family cysteine protease